MTSRAATIAASLCTCGPVVDHARGGTAASAMVCSPANHLEKRSRLRSCFKMERGSSQQVGPRTALVSDPRAQAVEHA